ncbi:hypothetical protein JCM10207_003743 [Rhodosporidiobolus poonsookiae]
MRRGLSSSFLLLVLAGAQVAVVQAHMSIWHRSMYGVDADLGNAAAGDPVAPLGPDWDTQDSWWFRGPTARALKPQAGEVMQLPAGGKVEVEIACNVAWTSYGARTTDPNSELSACPDNYGAYHTGDPSGPLDSSLLSGCALGIADVDNIADVTMDNLAIFSVKHDCVKQRYTDFAVPAKMPPCTGDKCICGWFWLANNGTANFYMTAFDCSVTGAPADATPIAPPQDPVFCGDAPGNCTQGSKRPLYAYNSPSNVPWYDNDHRPGYHASWSFGTDGAQNDIFLPASASSASTSTNSTFAGSPPIVSSLSSSAASSLASPSAPSTSPAPLPVTTAPVSTASRERLRPAFATVAEDDETSSRPAWRSRPTASPSSGSSGNSTRVRPDWRHSFRHHHRTRLSSNHAASTAPTSAAVALLPAQTDKAAIVDELAGLAMVAHVRRDDDDGSGAPALLVARAAKGEAETSGTGGRKTALDALSRLSLLPGFALTSPSASPALIPRDRLASRDCASPASSYPSASMASSVSVIAASPVPSSTTPPDPSPNPSVASASTSRYGLTPDGPSYPSTFSPGRAQHSRRPSRAERYEALVAGAREVLKRGSVGLEEIGLGFEEHEEKGKGREQLKPVDEREWREALRSLLKVVDGMSQQLATHDDLARELKIAQSNLALVETHSEFLEETLRRRDSRSGSQMARHLSNDGVPPLPRQRAQTEDGAEPMSPEEGSSGGAKSFFRLPSKRRQTPSTASVASNSTTNSMPPPNPPFAQTLRSVSSSPRLGNYSPNPSSPIPHPRFSTSTTSSSISEDSPSPNLATLAAAAMDGSLPSPSDLFAMQSQVASLETECNALRSNNTSLRRNNETLVGKCAELEKTKEDLMSELENLSVELFSEANTLVAEERRARAKAEEEITRLRAEIDSLNSQLAILRQLIASRSSSSSSQPIDPTSPDLPALPFNEPETPPMGITATLQPYSDSPARIPSPASIDRPVSSVSIASTSSASGRKWFSFGRSSSQSTTPDPPVPAFTPAPLSAHKPARAASHPAPNQPGVGANDSLRPPSMARGDSGSSYLSDASAASFFSFRSGGPHGEPPLSATSPDLTSRSSAEEERPAAAKGREKARELDLGIYIPGSGSIGMEKVESDGGKTVGLKTPVAVEMPRDVVEHARRQPLPASPLSPATFGPQAQARGPPRKEEREHVSSPPLPPIPPATPQIPSSTSPPGAPSSSLGTTTPTLSPPLARQPRNAGPRPLAIHTHLSPSVASPASPFTPLDPAQFGLGLNNTDVGGPRDEEMAAARKSPKSPNAMRWREVAGTLSSAAPSTDGRDKCGTRSRSNSHAREPSQRDREREKLPPSPALPTGFKDAPPAPAPPPAAPRAPSPLPPALQSQANPVPPRALKVDTAAPPPSVVIPPVLVGGVRALASARPASPAVAAAPRPPIARAASSNAVPSSAPPNPAPAPRSSAVPLAPQQAAASSRPSYLRADSTSSLRSGRPVSPVNPRRDGPPAQRGGMTPSTSASSLGSASTHTSTSSAGGTRPPPLRGLGGGPVRGDGRPLSPDGTKAVEDLESLMKSIMELNEGMFGQDEAAEGAQVGGQAR